MGISLITGADSFLHSDSFTDKGFGPLGDERINSAMILAPTATKRAGRQRNVAKGIVNLPALTPVLIACPTFCFGPLLWRTNHE